MTGTDLCVNKPPTTSLFWKGHQDASRTLEKMCWLRRGVRWRLTCASKCLAIMVLKKNQSRSYLNHLAHQSLRFIARHLTFNLLMWRIVYLEIHNTITHIFLRWYLMFSQWCCWGLGLLICVNWKTVTNTLKVLQLFKMSVTIHQSTKHNNP
jgi:hypothetical protein